MTSPSATGAEGPPPLLEIDRLNVSYGAARGGATRVLGDVSLTVRAGQIVGVIGETGSGKTTLARAAVGLVHPEPGGSVRFDGAELTRLHGADLREFRRSGRLQYMFQDPLRSQDPYMTIRQIVAEPLAVTGAGRQERDARTREALALVGLDADAFASRPPGALSGGQRQRVSLARALVTRPRLLITDEPASALDASNRNLVLGLLDRLRRELGLTVVVISHDLGSLPGIADRIAVLYRGRLVEDGPAHRVLAEPLHPYTALLTASAPRVGGTARLRPRHLRPPAGHAFGPDDEGCVFAPRCRFATPACRTEPLPAAVAGEAPPTGGDAPAGHTVACHHAADWRDRLRAQARHLQEHTDPAGPLDATHDGTPHDHAGQGAP